MNDKPVAELRAFVTPERTDAVQLAVDRAVARAALPEIEPAGSFVSQDIPEPPEVVWGMLHAGSKLVVGGASKSFKTWTLLYLAAAVSSGQPWLGFKTFQSRVLFINFELPRFAIQRRLQAISKALGVEPDDRFLSLWNLRGYSAPYQLLVPQIIDRIRGEGFRLVTMDPIYKTLGNADENSATDMAGLLNSLEQIAEIGAALAFGAHFSKGNQAAKNSIDRISGSGVFARDPDSILTFTAHEEENAFTVEPTLRNFKPVPPFVVRWDTPLMRRVDHLDPEKLKQPSKGRSQLYQPEQILDLLADESLSTKSWFGRAADELGMGRTTFHELLRKLRDQGIIRKTSNGLWQSEKSEKSNKSVHSISDVQSENTMYLDGRTTAPRKSKKSASFPSAS